jgi:hypothetical protein
LNEADAVALGLWFGCFGPAAYIAANLWLDRVNAFPHERQQLQNCVAALIGLPTSLAITLAWIALT